MKCVADVHYSVVRHNTAPYWQEPNDFGEIKSLDCAFCDFQILKRRVGQPRGSTSGLGRYNRMRGAMVKHLHAEHRDKLSDNKNSLGPAAR